MTLLRDKKGQALVEMALSIMLLMLILVGIFEFGRAMYIKNTLNNAARAGARQAVVTSGIKLADAPASFTKLSSMHLDNASIQATITNSLFNGIIKDNVEVNLYNATNAGTSAAKGDTIQVTVKLTDFEAFTKLIPIPDQLSGTASMRYE